MLCIEMAGFSIMHLFAYPWKPYSIKHSYNNPLNEPGTGYSGGIPKYQGGPFGIKAIIDAFNPWDIIKASARGFRWLFVGYRHRLDDSSYQPAKLSGNTGYTGPSFAGNNEAATELNSHANPGRSRTDTHGPYHAEDDRAGLLRNPQHPSDTAPYRAYEHDEYAHSEDLDSSLRTPSHPPRAVSPSIGVAVTGDMKPSDYDEYEETGYHPGMGPPPGSGIPTGLSGGVHPAYRPGGQASSTQGERYNSSSPWAAPYPQSLHEGQGPSPVQRPYDPHAS